MNKKSSLLVVTLLTLLVACGGGGEGERNAACAGDGETGDGALMSMTGDSIYNAELQINLPVNLDHSSARSIVESYLSIQRVNHDPEMEKAGRAVADKFKSLLHEELERLEAEFMTEDQQKAVKKAREEDKEKPDLYDSETSKYEFVDEKELDDGTVMIESKAVRTIRTRESADAEWEEEIREKLQRAYCVEEDGKWYILRVENARKDNSGPAEDESEWKWMPESNSPAAILYRLEKSSSDTDRPDKAPAINAGTPEGAAQSLLDVAELQSASRSVGMEVAFRFLADNYAPAYSKKAHEEAKKEADDWGDGDDREPKIGEVLKLSDTESEVRVEIPAWGDRFRTIGIRVRKIGDEWRVYETGRYRKNYSNEELEYEKNEDIYEVD